MQFDEFCNVMFSLLDQEHIAVSETTSLKHELDVDSLQMVNLTTKMADHYQIPFSLFIENADKIDIVGGLYSIIKEGVNE